MNRKLLERALDDAFPTSDLRRAQRLRGQTAKRSGRRASRIRSNTTILAMKYRGGILCAADRKTSGWGYSIVSQESIKIYPASALSALLGSGSVSSIQLAESTLKAANREFLEENDFPMTMSGQANYLSQMIRLWSAYYGDSFCVGMILAGLDEDGLTLYDLEDDGCLLNRGDYVASGSGGFRAEDQLDARWHPDLSLQEALVVAMHAMIHVGHRDSGSSEPLAATPTVAAITMPQGFHFLPERTIQSALGKALLTKRWANKSFARALIQGGRAL